MSTLYPVVILAGGLATRLRPLTTHIPKSMLMIQGEPFISHQLLLLKSQGVEKVVIALGYLGDMIQAFVRDGSRYGLQVRYSHEDNGLLGTGGAIKKALTIIDQPTFFVLYGDSYLLCDYHAVQQTFEKANAYALMTILKNENQWDKSNVAYQDGKIKSYDKYYQTTHMHYIDYGLGVFNQTIFAALQDKQCYDLASIYQTCIQQNNLAAYEVKQRFYEIGSIAGIAELEYYLATQKTA